MDSSKTKSFLDKKMVTIIKKNLIILIGIGVFIIFSIILYNKHFLSPINLLNILRQTAVISIMATGFAMLLGSGEFDLSIGSVIALSSLTSAIVLLKAGIIASVITALGVGAIVGFINGFLVLKGRMPSFLATIATMSIFQGFARLITNLKAVPVINEQFRFFFGKGDVLKIPILFLWTIVIVTLGHLCMTQTPFSRKILAIGGNKTAAIFAGINIIKIKWILFILMGIVGGLVGLLFNGRLAAARYTYGTHELFTIVAAVVIGGNSIYGGKVTIIGALIGSLIIGIMNNGLIIAGLSPSVQIIFRGIIIIVAVIIYEYSEKEKV